MTICERMFEIMDKKGVTSYQIGKTLGLAKSTLSNWKSRNTDPPAQYLVPICNLLHCSVSYLLTGQDETETEKAPVPGISENGCEMLELFEQLPEREQILLIGRLQEMVSPVSSEGKGGDDTAESSTVKAV